LRIAEVPDARIIEPTDALVTVTHACICGSDLWPYKLLEPTKAGRPMGHEAIGIVEDVGSEVRSNALTRKRRAALHGNSSAVARDRGLPLWVCCPETSDPVPTRAVERMP
jgi:NADPH:quinone reductase-like Zn-dependent oxidoreductase